MPIYAKLAAALLAWAFQAGSPPAVPQAIVEDKSHFSQVLGETRHYRVFLPPAYTASAKRYPVVYWFHGWSERYNRPPRNRPGRNYDQGPDYGGDTIARFVGAHDLIVVKWDGYNPRTPGEDYLRPYNVSPVETARQFPLYFPELVEHIDGAYRTIADRERRAVAGLSMGGFLSYWVAGKYPDLVGSASNFMGSPEFFVGPRGFDVEINHDDLHGNFEGVRTRLVTGTQDFIRWHHARMNALWLHTRAAHETEAFDSDHGTPGMSKTLDFHLRAFAAPLPRPQSWSHADVYPNFTVWGWSAASDRRRPALTHLENVSRAGFRSSVREWLPEGAPLASVKLSLASAKLYPPGSAQPVTAVRLSDSTVRRTLRKADAEGRLQFELDGDAWEVGVGAGPVIAIAGHRVEGAAWAAAGEPVKLRVRFLNKGAARSATAAVKWESLGEGVSVDPPSARVFALASGEAAEIPLTLLVADPARPVVRLYAVLGETRLPLDVPLYPPAQPAPRFLIADGRPMPVWRRAMKIEETSLGEGNGDGHAAPGEQFAILLPDGEGFRAAELFTNHPCLDNSARASDVWGEYDHVGASVKYSLPAVKEDCAPGTVVRMLARVTLPAKPEHRLTHFIVELPVWWKTPPKK